MKNQTIYKQEVGIIFTFNKKNFKSRVKILCKNLHYLRIILIISKILQDTSDNRILIAGLATPKGLLTLSDTKIYNQTNYTARTHL